jgi:hypothetical protein
MEGIVRALTTAASLGRHTFSAVIEAFVILAIVATLALGLALASHSAPGGQAALAARGGGSAGSISVPNGVYGGTTTATVTTSSSGLMAFAQCYQRDARVYAQFVSLDGNGHATFKLGPTQLWTGGAATCTAEAGNFGHGGGWRALAATTFSAPG